MRLKAVLGIKDCAGRKIRNYRIQDLDTNQIKDIPIKTIIETIKIKGIYIKGLQLRDNKLIETYNIPTIPELRKSSISLYEWCQMNKERGQRILYEFENGNNFPITTHDVSKSSNMKMKFRCITCHKISEQCIRSKTSECDCKCKYCAGFTDISLQDWCLKEPTGYGKRLLQEYIQGNNTTPPDKVLYGSARKAYFKCSNCGSVNYELIHIRTKHKRKFCIKCDKTQTSFGEQLLLKWLNQQGLQTVGQHPITNEIGHKKYDIYLPQLNLVIEKQSAEHLSIEQQFRDETGALIAQHQGINYLEICELTSKYFREENNWCLTYHRGHEPDIIQKLSTWLLKNYNIQTNPNYTRELEDEAYLASCTVKKENSLAAHNPSFLREWYQPLNGKVTPGIVALNANRKYYWQCPICSHIYLATPSSRNCSGTACPNYRQHKKIRGNQ